MDYEEKCEPGYVWRKPHTRITTKGKAKIKGKCVKVRSPTTSKSPRRSPSPRVFLGPSHCKSTERWRKEHERHLRDGTIKTFPGRCVSLPKGFVAKKSPVRKSPVKGSPCPPGQYRRAGYVVKKTGTVVNSRCVNERGTGRASPKPKPKKSPKQDPRCKAGEVYRKRHQRTRPDGTKYWVEEKCIKAKGGRSPAKKSPHDCPPGHHWRKGYQRNGKVIDGKCVRTHVKSPKYRSPKVYSIII